MEGATHGGKGSCPRPVNKQKFEENHEKIFGKRKMDYQPEEVRNEWESAGEPFTWGADEYELMFNPATGEHKHYNHTTDSFENF